MKKKVIAWWSGGVTSAVACKIAIELYGSENVVLVFIDTRNEDPDTFRFMQDCEAWYGQRIMKISSSVYPSIQSVWYKYNSLNVSHGAICSSELKRAVREAYQKITPHSAQVFGFDIDEPKRAKAMRLNYEEINPVFPLLLMGYSKNKCISILQEEGIEIPVAYRFGLQNNNCLQTGCVQGGIGYWQKIRQLFPEKFEKMAQVEHELSERKGKPVTMLKDQALNGGLVFLKHNPMFPEVIDISMMKGRMPESLVECNGFCGTNDLAEKLRVGELNFEPA